MAKSAQITISEVWPDHVGHKTVGKAPRWDKEQGVICACGEVLGWPDGETETYSQTLERETKESMAAAQANARKAVTEAGKAIHEGATEARKVAAAVVKGAFGTYAKPVEDAPLPEPELTTEEAVSALVDADEPDLYEPTPEEEAEWEERQRAFNQSLLPPEDDDSPPWDVDDAKAAEDRDATFQGEPEGDVPEPAGSSVVDSPVGRDVVPYAGVPIYPTEEQQLDPLVGSLAPLDPTQPYTPADVELKIVSILRQLENSETFLRQQLARLHQATHNHTMRYNLAIARSNARAADQRKAEAVVLCEQESFEMTQAEMLVKALRDSQHNLRSQLSGFQSVARSLGVSLTNSLDGRDTKRVESYREPPEPEPAPWEYN